MAMTSEVLGDGRRASALLLLDLVRDFVLMSGRSIAGAGDFMKKDCTDLIRRIALLLHLAEDIINFSGGEKLEELNDAASSRYDTVNASSLDCLSDVVGAIQAAKRLLYAALTFSGNVDSSATDGETTKLVSQFQQVTTRLETALANLPYDHLRISDEVQEQVDLVRAQLSRASKKYESMSELADKKFHVRGSVKWKVDNDVKNMRTVDDEAAVIVAGLQHYSRHRGDRVGFDSVELKRTDSYSQECSSLAHSDDIEGVLASKGQDEDGKSDEIVIPENFLCPMSLELMIDPVMVSTGETYERSNIERWIDSGNTTCPKTQKQLRSLVLTPNFLIKQLISEWCNENNIKLKEGLTNRKLEKSDGSFDNGGERTVPIKTLVRHLSFGSFKEQKEAVTEIRKLSKSSTDHRIKLADAGVIPHLVKLLTSDDVITQENAISSILNLSLHEENKKLVMLSGAVSFISLVLKVGSIEGRESAAATIYSLSLAEENKPIIGASGVIPGLLEILEIGSTMGKKDAARALLNLCMYQENKGRALRAGIVKPLMTMLSDSNDSLVGEALYIMSVICDHSEAKAAMAKANSLLALTNILKTGQPRSKELAAAVLLQLCRGNLESLSWLSRLGAMLPLMKLAENGTERGRRKANSLLEQLRRV